jgi:hypothetical protein
MQMRLGFPLLMLLAAGCASEPTRQTAEAAPQPCQREYRVGSNIPVKNCDAPMTEEERQRMISDIQNQTKPIAKPAGGG